MRSRLGAIFRHAGVMVTRRIKTYFFLSVTIIMSFSFLFGYLLYSDSQLYNKYKTIFMQRRGDLLIYTDIDKESPEKRRMFVEKLDAMEGTEYFCAYNGSLGHSTTFYDRQTFFGTQDSTPFSLLQQNAYFFPDYAWLNLMHCLMGGEPQEIRWLDGREGNDFYLEADEAVMGDEMFYALGLDKEETPIYHFSNGDFQIDLRVVGVVPGRLNIFTDSFGTSVWPDSLYLSVKLLDRLESVGAEAFPEELPLWRGFIWGTYYFISSDTPEQVAALAETMGYNINYSVYKEQNKALEQMQAQAGNKAIIACALLVLLGINLYSSFSNAMNERKYEIGVKRAVGASAWSIVRQFLYESLLVMMANVAISIALVVDVGVLYKIFMEWQSGFLDTYVLYLTPHSMVIFGACAVTLTVVFSLIFAYKSTQVEIVQYLKAE